MNEAPESPSRIGCRGRLVALGLLAPFTSGCDPVVNFYGSFFPAWVLALGAGIFLTILLRWLFAILKIEQHLGPLVLVYSALTLLLTCATWLALFAPEPMATEVPSSRLLPWVGRSIGLLILLASLAAAWKVTRVNFEFPRTDDAEVRANLIGIAPHVSGPLVELRVVDNQEVQEGELLFVIDPRPYQSALDAAEADLNVARSELQAMSNVVASAEAEVKVREAQLSQAADVVRRYEPLLKTQAIEALTVDSAQTDVRTATAQLEAAQQSLARQQFLLGKSGTYFARVAAAEAAVEAARLNVGYCRVVAPFNGRVANLNLAVGRYAQVGQSLFGLLDTRKWYVIANYRETYLQSIRPGAKVDVFLMAYPGHSFRGVVEGVGWAVQTDASVSSGILSESRPDLNWVRLAQRLPVRIVLDPPEPGFPFRMGLTAVTTIRPASAPNSDTH